MDQDRIRAQIFALKDIKIYLIRDVDYETKTIVENLDLLISQMEKDVGIKLRPESDSSTIV